MLPTSRTQPYGWYLVMEKYNNPPYVTKPAPYLGICKSWTLDSGLDTSELILHWCHEALTV